jgi:hypothetical protein
MWPKVYSFLLHQLHRLCRVEMIRKENDVEASSRGLSLRYFCLERLMTEISVMITRFGGSGI